MSSKILPIMLITFILGLYIPTLSYSESLEVDVLIEDDIRHLRSQARLLNEQERKINKLKKQVESIEIVKDSTIEFDESEWNKANKKLEEIIKLEDSADVSKQLNSFFVNLLNAVDIPGRRSNLWEELYLASKIYDRNSYEYSLVRAASDVARVYNQVEFKKIINSDAPILTILDDDFDFDLRTNYDKQITKEEAYKNLSKLKLIFDKNLKSQIQFIEESIHKSNIAEKSKVLNYLNSELENKTDELSNTKDALSKKLTVYKAIHKQEEKRRTQIDQSLVYAVYGMIVVLLLLFLSLKVFSDDVAQSLIEKRSLVEVTGMAFMLITIIILGTGEKLSKEILGTLLGTIAGYVFARGTENKKVSDEDGA